MQTILLSYTLRDDVATDDVEARIRGFVAAIAALDLGIEYTSYRERDQPRSYRHVGRFPDDATVRRLQAAAFFPEFTAYLRGVTAAPVQATWGELVGTTR